MALINCKECGKEVSTEAKSCPHCGAKQPQKSIWLKVFSVIFIMIAGLFIIGLIFSDSDQVRQEKYTKARAECAQIAAKTALAAPGSFDRAHEAIGMKTIKECMSSRGFEIEFK